jgi:purine-binding chemotaxis protein CheW
MKQQHNDSIKSKKAAELRQTFDHSFALPPSAASPEVQDLLTIRVLGNPYAIRLLDITELLTGHKIIPVPAVTSGLLGLAGIRGDIVPVFCLSSIIGYGPDIESPRWMVLCNPEEPIALALSDFEGHLRIPTSALHTAEKFSATTEKTKYVSQVARTPDGIRAIISIEPIMATIRNRISTHRPTKE